MHAKFFKLLEFLLSQADKDGNSVVDYTEFAKLWAAIRGEGEVDYSRIAWLYVKFDKFITPTLIIIA